MHPPQNVASAAPLPLPLPLPGAAPAAPTPTLIEYSGYGYADPAGPQSGIAILANLMGFTVVDVNMRGTGCSGGAYDFFEPLQSLDGYDVIETIARQPWVAHGKVGMMGISYGGISQLFTAATQPPSLAAISPLSVLDAAQTTLYPGGVLNTGFALNWAKERVHDAKPASEKEGQPWAYKRIQEGDETCKANQALHGQAVDLLAKVRANRHYKPKVADPLAPATFVKKISVPSFVACQHTDEQTGGHCPTLASRFTGTQRKWFTFSNGTHVDSLDPETFNRWYDFLELYVAQEAPITHSAAIRGAAPLIYQEAMGISGVTLPPDPIQEKPTYQEALTAFEQLPPVRVLFDNGAGGDQPGQPYEHSFAGFPVPGTKGRSFYLARGGALGAKRPAAPARTASSGTPTPARSRTSRGTRARAAYGARRPTTTGPRTRPGSAVSYVSKPLAANTTVLGAGAVRVWLRSSRPSVDLQATISELPAGRQGDVRTGRLGARRRAQARRPQEARRSSPC